MPSIAMYVRVSTEDQKGALAQQRFTVESYAKFIMASQPEYDTLLPYFEEAESAHKVEFANRPVGKHLCRILETGDMIIMARHDRGFRNSRDFANQMKRWGDDKITVYFCDLQISSSSSAGQMLATILVAVAQNFSDSLSERQKLAWAQRHLRDGKFDAKYKIWLKKIIRSDSGASDLVVLDKQAISYIRYVMWRRRYSFKKNGVADSWNQCCNDLERARVIHGDLEKYREDHKRDRWNCANIWHHIRRLRASELPAVKMSWCCVSIRSGLDPFKLESRTKAGGQVGQKKPMRPRESLYLSAVSKSIIKPNAKPPKRWCRAFDQCVICNTPDWPHKASGVCAKCSDSEAAKEWRAKKAMA